MLTLEQKNQIHAHSFEILEAYGVKPVNGSFSPCRCPFHDDAKASFSARQDADGRVFWKCFAGCGQGSDVFSFVAKIENLDEGRDFAKVASLAARAAGLSLDADAARAPMPPKVAAAAKEEAAKEEAPQTFVPDSLIAAYAAEVEQSNLFKYLANLWPLDAVLQVMRQYKVGRYSKSLCGCAAASVFPSIDVDGRVTAYKAIPYPETSHHRIKAAKGSNDKDVYWHVPQGCKACYFGLHLLPSMPDKPVALVESEKTAIVGALDCPEYVWIATQGITQVDAAKLAPLKGRTIHLFPDADGLEDWRNKAVEMRQDGHTVKVRDEIIKRLDPKSKLDIGDVLLYARRKQIIKESLL